MEQKIFCAHRPLSLYNFLSLCQITSPRHHHWPRHSMSLFEKIVLGCVWSVVFRGMSYPSVLSFSMVERILSGLFGKRNSIHIPYSVLCKRKKNWSKRSIALIKMVFRSFHPISQIEQIHGIDPWFGQWHSQRWLVGFSFHLPFYRAHCHCDRKRERKMTKKCLSSTFSLTVLPNCIIPICELIL